MAITRTAARFLIEARASGVSFERTLTIGRQKLLASPLWLARELATRGYIEPSERERWAERISRRPYVADEFFRALGVEDLQTLDNSDYEGADVIHDLNRPVPETLHHSFDLVFDGGSLEHVFEFTTALRSVMAMVKVGGHLLIGTPTNNYSGHGFYQFSPELYFRALDDRSGFQVERMLVVDADVFVGPNFLGELVGDRYLLEDPEGAFSRHESFTSRNRALLLVQARRVADREPLTEAPQQGSWTQKWDAHATTPADDGSPARWAQVPPPIRARVFHMMLGGSGRLIGAVRRPLFRVMARRRALRRSGEAWRRLQD